MKHFTQKTRLKRWQKQASGTNGWTEFNVRVDVAIDFDRMCVMLGTKALGNKSKATRMLGGLITAEVREIEQVPS